MEVGVLVFWALLIGAMLFFLWSSTTPVDSSTIKIFPGSYAGDMSRSSTTELPVSFNQPEGLTYSYSAWLLVKDFGKGYGEARTIFSKGDSPGLSIDSTSNSLIVTIQTFGAKETILIPSVPAMKWLHIALVVDQQSVDIYINGILRQHHTLGQLPRQNDKPFVIGSGWDGVVADITYYTRSLKHLEIKEMAREEPPDDLQRAPSAPQYFDISWYIGRLYSK